jgi:hypothetical protein
MKRIALALCLVLVIAFTAPALDLQLLGQDFDTFIYGFGEELLPDLAQAAIWGQFPGTAVYPEDSNFFFTISTGAILTGGIFTFTDPDDNPFEVLDVPNILDEQLTAAGVGGFYDGIRNFFPVPVLRLSSGFRLPGDLELMFDLSGFPQFITDAVTGLVPDVDNITLNAFHAGTRVRYGLLKEEGAFPAISIGGGYSFSGFQLGYGLGSIGTPVDKSGIPGNPDGTYGSTNLPNGWTLFLLGDLLMGSTIHSFGFDFQVSKQFGVFAPFIGVSPYYQLASFTGNIGGPDGGGFGAFISYNNGGSDVDAEYNADAPVASWVDNDLSLLLTGGVDLVLGGFVLEVHGSWNVADGSPGAKLGFRFQ